MAGSIIRTGVVQTVGLAVLALFLTYAAGALFGGLIPAILAFCVFGIAWFAAVTSSEKWVRIVSITLMALAAILVATIAALFWVAYG